LENIPLENLGDLLQNEDHDLQLNWPVDLLDLRQELRNLCIGRAPKKQLDVGKIP